MHRSIVVAQARPVLGVHRKPPFSTTSPNAPPGYMQPPFGGDVELLEQAATGAR
jgi:hypothetical protein